MDRGLLNREHPMDVVLQLSLLTVSVCVGAAAIVWRTAVRSGSDAPARIDVDPVSSTWLADFKVRGRSEYRTE
jgi:hypothetical protein